MGSTKVIGSECGFVRKVSACENNIYIDASSKLGTVKELYRITTIRENGGVLRDLQIFKSKR